MTDAPFLPGLPSVPPAPPKRRNRAREGAGRSDKSYIKQGLIRRAVYAQAFAYRHTHQGASMVFIDGNAGDGEGVPLPQLDLFGDDLSRPTPLILTDLASKVGASVLLCEKDRAKHAQLKTRFPQAQIIGNNAEAPSYVPADCTYVLWLSDPCGQSGHGPDAMREIAARSRQSDFVIVQNLTAHRRYAGTKDHPLWEVARTRYLPMNDPSYWASLLNKRGVAIGDTIKQSAGFHFRLWVVANYLADHISRTYRVHWI